MRTLVHLSDLHFGRVDEALLQPLVDSVAAARPDIVVVSGDLTQRARTAQFREAAAFLARLPGPQLVVPGNHDVPLYNIVHRLLRPLAKFRRHIEPNLSPTFIDTEMAVVGINTARAMVVKQGRVNEAQLGALNGVLSPLSDEVVKVVVTHHPFDVSSRGGNRDIVGRAERAMQVFDRAGVDVLLAGHLHQSANDSTGRRYALSGYEALVVSAGTATSTRSRGESNSFNVLTLSKQRIDVERREWSERANAFLSANRESFVRRDRGWQRLANTDGDHGA